LIENFPAMMAAYAAADGPDWTASGIIEPALDYGAHDFLERNNADRCSWVAHHAPALVGSIR
jgi:hypothetical protein